MSGSWRVLGTEICALGESPFWHPEEQTLYWVDITAKRILRANVYTGDVQRWDLPGEPGCIAPAASGGLVMALRDGIYRARAWGGPLQHLATLPYDPRTVRANDGKCDALGRFWVGTVDETKRNQAAALYVVDARGGTIQVRTAIKDALTGNGLAWSTDQRSLYWADTPRHQVRSWPFELATATLGDPDIFLQFSPKPAEWNFADRSYAGRPDGATVDASGNYWVAQYEGRRVAQYAPDGTLLQELQVPAQCPTMPCLGGEDFKTLYVTSVSQGRSAAELAEMPQSGAVFHTRVASPGQRVNFFVDE